MARPLTKKQRVKSAHDTPNVIKLKDITGLIYSILVDTSYFWYMAAILLLGELLLNLFIIQRVPYTEIDWVAYMQEVKGFVDGERDYKNLSGNTGPLVYPAGFVYIYSALYYLTNKGTHVRLCQYLFGGLYLATQAIVFALYSTSKKFPPYALVLLCISKRLHSIYALRCFNDPVAMFFMYLCLLAMVHKRWTLGSILYSMALSVKMNVLLFFPAFGVLLWQAVGAWSTLGLLMLIVGSQMILAYPFLSTYPESYISRAFEFNRVFDYQWTVNWRMFDEKTFGSSSFANTLLAGHAIVLVIFLCVVCHKKGGLVRVFLRGFSTHPTARHTPSPDDVLFMMFTCNFIGMIFARSLHYQFYSWYYHAIPYLLWQSEWMTGGESSHKYTRVFLLATIEGCWLTFPSTERSSWTLLACHILLLLGLVPSHQKESTNHPASSVRTSL
ncbi:glycosyltransferase [Spinellus fusiger]|nr:glycosyltransferase [Spinellus fusiger]